MEEGNSSISELTSSNPLNFALLDDLPDLNVQPKESNCQLAPLVLLADSDDRPRSSSVESLVLFDLNDEPKNPTVVPLDLFPDLTNNEPTNSSDDVVDLNHEARNPSLVTLDLFPSSKEEDKEEPSTKQVLGTSTTTTPASCSLENNNVVSCCSSTTTEVREETVAVAPITAPTPIRLSDIMNIDHNGPQVPIVSIKRKPMDVDYSSHHDPNPKSPKRIKKAAPYCDRRKPGKRFAPHRDEQCGKCGADMEKTLCRNMKVSIMLTVKNIPAKEAGSLGDIEELAEEFMQQLDMRRKEKSQQRAGVLQLNHLLSESQHVVLIE